MSATSAALRDDARVIGLIGLGHGVSHFYQLVIPSLFPWLKPAFGLSYAQLGLITTVFFVVSGVAQAAAGFVVDRFGARRVLMGGAALLAAGALLAALADGYASLVAAAALIGLGNSVYHPADFAVLNSRIAPQRLGHAFSVHGLTGNLGYAAAPALMFAIASSAGWRVALACAVAAALVIALLVAAVPGAFDSDANGRGAQGMRAAQADGSRFGWLNGAVLGFFSFFILVTMTAVGIQNFAPQVLDKLYGIGLAAGASVLTAYLLAAAAGTVAGGFVAHHVRRHETAACASLVAAAGLLALAASGWLGAAGAMVALCATGWLLGMVAPLRDLLIRQTATTGNMGRVYGVVYSGIDVGAAIGPVVVGLYLDRAQPTAAWLWLAVSLLAAGLVSLLVGTRMRQATAAA